MIDTVENWKKKREKLVKERKVWLENASSSLDPAFSKRQAEKLTEQINKIDYYLNQIK